MQTTLPDSLGGISRIKAIGLGLFLAAYGVFSVLLKNELREEKSPLVQLPLGKPMPDFTLRDAEGNEFTLSKLASQHKVILVDFWASWCQPCRFEMPELGAMAEADGPKGLLILAINEDQQPEQFAAYMREKPVTFPVLLDPQGKLAERLGIRAFPTTVLVTSDGRINAVFEGLDQFLRGRVELMLNGRSPPLTRSPAGTSGPAHPAAPPAKGQP